MISALFIEAVLTSRAGNGYITSAAGNAQARFTARAFEIYVLSVGKSGEKAEKPFILLLEATPKAKEFLIFDASVAVIARKGAKTPNGKQRKLKQRKHHFGNAVGDKGHTAANERGDDEREIQLIAAVAADKKSSEQFLLLLYARFELPSGSAHFIEGVNSLPAELALCLACIGIAFRDIAGTAVCDLIRNFNVVYALERIDKLKHRIAVAGTEVIDRNAALFKCLECRIVSCRKVENVDKIAHAGTVAGIVIVTENVEMRKRSLCNAGNVGHKVVGNTVGVIADKCAVVRAEGIEIAEKNDRETVVRNAKVGKNTLDIELGGAVGVGGGKREILFYRNGFGLAVNGCTRGEHELEAIVVAHFEDKVKGTRDIIVIIFDRLCHRFADSLKARKVNNGIYIVFIKNALYALSVEKVDIIKLGTDTGYLLDKADNLLLGVGKVIENDNFLSLFDKINAGMGADIARTAGYKYAHFLPLNSVSFLYFQYNMYFRDCQ